MNVENIKKLRAFVRNIPAKNFNMAHWAKHRGKDRVNRKHLIEHGCGTTACLAGATIALFCDDIKIIDNNDFDVSNIQNNLTYKKYDPVTDKCEKVPNLANRAMKILGLGFQQAKNLFTGNWEEGDFNFNLNTVTKAEALRQLTHMIGDNYGERK